MWARTHIAVFVQQFSVLTEIHPCSTLHILGFAPYDHQRFLRPAAELLIMCNKILQTAESVGLLQKHGREDVAISP